MGLSFTVTAPNISKPFSSQSNLDVVNRAPSVGEFIEKGDNFWFGASGYLPKPTAGIDVDPDSAMRCAAAYACSRAIAETLASLPAMVYEQLSDNARQKATEHDIYKLLHDAPNPGMDSMQYMELMALRLVNRGNAFAEIVRNESGEPVELWPIHNSRVRPFRLPGHEENGRYIPGKLYWLVSVSGTRYSPGEEEREYQVPERDMINVVGFNSSDGLIAKGVIPEAAEEISLNTAAQLYGSSFFGNGARPQGIVEHPSFIKDPSERAAFRDDINRVHQGRENWNNVGVLWGSAKWKELQVSPEQAQMIETRRMSGKVICQYYGVPPAIIQIFDDYKFSTVEAMLKQFVMLTIRPYAVRFERAFGTQLLKDLPDNLLMEFALNALLRGDPKAQADANKTKLLHGALNQDEWRAQDNLNPLPDGQGQHYFMPLNHAPLEQIVNGASVVANSDRRGKKNGELLKYATKVLESGFQRMVRIEINTIEKAATAPEKFLSAVDSFYEKFVSKLAEAIEPGVTGIAQAEGIRTNPKTLAHAAALEYCESNRSDVVAASECDADELQENVAALVKSWESRTLSICQKDKEGSNDKAA